MSLATLMVETQGSAVISAEDLADLIALRRPRAADYVVKDPHITMVCDCENEQPAELFIITCWNPTTFVCPDCYGITA